MLSIELKMATTPYIRPLIIGKKRYNLLKAIEKGTIIDPLLSQNDFEGEPVYLGPGNKCDVQQNKAGEWIYTAYNEEDEVVGMRLLTLDESVEIKDLPRKTRSRSKPKILKLSNGKRYDLEQAVTRGYDSQPLDPKEFVRLIYNEPDEPWVIWKISSREYVYKEYNPNKLTKVEKTKILKLKEALEVISEEEREYEGEDIAEEPQGEEDNEVAQVQESFKNFFKLDNEGSPDPNRVKDNLDQLTLFMARTQVKNNQTMANMQAMLSNLVAEK